MTPKPGLSTRDGALWALRLLWFFQPVTVGSVLGQAATDWERGSVVVAGAWVVWGVGVLASAVTLPISLTVIRIVAPLSAATVVALVAIEGVSMVALAGLVAALGAAAVALSALVGDRMVDGASYGDERRMLLRPGTLLLVGPVPLVWLLAALGIVSGPVLVVVGGWLAGLVGFLGGLACLWVAGRSLHQLSTRWVVFVPTGFVLHDGLAITEPVLFRRTAVERLGVAIAGTPAIDLSMGAAGLLVECELTDPAPLGLRSSGGGSSAQARLTDIRRFMMVPSRPGELLDEAAKRGFGPAD